MELVVEVMDAIFTLTDDEKEKMKVEIDFLHNNKKIKSVNFFKKFSFFLKNWIIKKFL
jgi:hypothetical protein